MKLNEFLRQKYPDNQVMRESARLFSQHKLHGESGAPLTGAYWWYPLTKRKTIVKWKLVSFYDIRYDDDTAHMDRWPDALEVIAIANHRDATALVRALRDNYPCLPRGRVSRMVGDDAGFALCHGNDSPASLDLVVREFNLTDLKAAGKVKLVFDEHETMLEPDVKRAEKILGATWSGLGMSSSDDQCD